ncbi:hypothetical protein PUNSTDRAFT_112727 [Punctularia strigosozonata HHB-11173 SS5]|uniref:uncharacterized protein n=1 Tax=Punctularia strigosozonata (strain HHB-11173) TaxID=741275 RepID=UPI0004416A3B|nr:uncharacterized protein PUNSTDRAFT_112727 [Punctularia strigosozonata HHB-11173 SS5]EIN10938.1 hypothetical protein PUNSTDRAFT_112727 [Punctularia strigosozonata HHB-11173 SS5]
MPRDREANVWLPRLRFRRHRGLASLADVLSGNTCPPMSLADFEHYLAFVEHSLENLQFVVWYRDYRARFFALPPDVQARSFAQPSESTTTAAASTSARCTFRLEGRPGVVKKHRRAERSQRTIEQLRRTWQDRQALGLWADEQRKRMERARPLPVKACEPIAGPSSSSDGSTGCEPSAPPMARISPTSSTSSSSPLQPSPPTPTPPTSPFSPSFDLLTSPAQQPFRSECQLVLATFVRPGAPKELSLESLVRDTVLRDLAWNTHPDAFLPAYEEAWDALESHLLPNFLAHAVSNMNRAKQAFLYVVGTLCLLLSIAGAALLVALADERAYRGFVLPFAFATALSLGGAVNGMCIEQWTRGVAQVRTWEMGREGDEQAETWWAGRVNEGLGVVDEAKAGEEEKEENTLAEIAPWMVGGEEEVVPDEYQRPAIFGPEKIVVDPRIRRLQTRAVLSIIIASFLYAIGFGAVVLALPRMRQ